MAHIGGPTFSSRSLVMSVAQPVLVFDADNLDKKVYHQLLTQLQKQSLLQVAAV